MSGIRITRVWNEFKIILGAPEGSRGHAIYVREEAEIGRVVAHYYMLPSHDENVCPLCEQIRRKRREGKR